MLYNILPSTTMKILQHVVEFWPFRRIIVNRY